MDLYIYIDESRDISNILKGNSADKFYVGMSMVDREINQKIINDALDDLNKIPDLGQADKDCLQRKYFHASEDGPEAHSCLCKKIAAYDQLSFSYEIFDIALADEFTKPLTSSEARLHQLMTFMSATVTSHARVDCVHIYVAQREKSFPAGIEEMWRQKFYDILVKCAGHMPQMATYFPNLEITVVKGDAPGIQVCDFLLWAAIRKFEVKTDATWSDRVGLKFNSSSTSQNHPFSRSKYYIHRPIKYPFVIYDLDKTKKPPDSYSYDVLRELLIFAENCIRNYTIKRLPVHASHLQEKVDRIAQLLKSSEITTEDLASLADAFIQIADTVPIYNKTSSDEIYKVIKTKNILGIVYIAEDPRWFTISTWWIGERKKMFSSSPSVFLS